MVAKVKVNFILDFDFGKNNHCTKMVTDFALVYNIDELLPTAILLGGFVGIVLGLLSGILSLRSSIRPATSARQVEKQEPAFGGAQLYCKGLIVCVQKYQAVLQSEHTFIDHITNMLPDYRKQFGTKKITKNDIILPYLPEEMQLASPVTPEPLPHKRSFMRLEPALAPPMGSNMMGENLSGVLQLFNTLTEEYRSRAFEAICEMSAQEMQILATPDSLPKNTEFFKPIQLTEFEFRIAEHMLSNHILPFRTGSAGNEFFAPFSM